MENKLNALDALKLARTTPGTKVRPKEHHHGVWYEAFEDGIYRCETGKKFGEMPDVSAYHIVNAFGNEIEWEVLNG